jgi:hypothetical protein
MINKKMDTSMRNINANECDISFQEWDNLKSSFAGKMLSRDFPACGIKYTGKHGPGLVLALASASLDSILQKASAANEDKSYVFIIPDSVAAVYGLNIPLLTDVV